MTVRRYSSPEGFKAALEQRLRNTSKDGTNFARRRQVLIFERFLARVALVFGDAATLIPSFFAKHRPPCYWASYGSSGRLAIPLAIFAIQSGP